MTAVTPLVSILIPCFNAEAWVAETIESTLAQTWPNTEIIVVDDGSWDQSSRVVERFANRGVKLIVQPNRGASSARNTALRAARGEYIQFLDADDLIGPRKIELQINRLAHAPSNSIASGEWARFTNDAEEAKFIPEPIWRDLTGLEFQLLHYEEGWMMQPAAWLCPREVLDQAGPWDEKLSLNDDGEYFSRVMLTAPSIYFSSGAKTYYRSGVSGSLSRRKDVAALESLWRSTELNCSRLLKAAENSTRAKAAASNGWQRLAFELYPTLPKLAEKAEARMRELGPPTHRLAMGPTFDRVARITGWRFAKRLREITSR